MKMLEKKFDFFVLNCYIDQKKIMCFVCFCFFKCSVFIM